MSRSRAWSVVLAFGDERATDAPAELDPALWFEAACLDTLEALLATVEPTQLTVITHLDAVATAAREAGARVMEPGRDLNADVTRALAAWAATAPERSGLVVVGPLPYATPEALLAMLRACAATEAATVRADDGGTVALSHHDPARITARFGGASASRHARDSVVVAEHVDGLSRAYENGRTLTGRHTSALAATPHEAGTTEPVTDTGLPNPRG